MKKQKEDKPPRRIYEAEFLETDVVVWGEKEAKEVYEIGCYGKVKDDKLILSLCEALHLMERNRLIVKKDGKELTKKEFFELATKIDREFSQKYIVYKDLRERGYLVRTGFKFGTHFRVYERGVKLKKGPKSKKEHTKWIVHAVPENFTCSYAELSRAVRLAHNIRAKMLWAVIDEEGDVTYYEIIRITP
ncbi:MAG: tRNA-intron lyase [Candidatus Aenigmarchaeota archaeon]|nr:tRNA-intron lyase [Candidatus Aenigmarchaeota archaeon]